MQPIYKRHRRTCCLLAVCRYLSQSATRQVSPDAPGPGNQSGPGALALRGRGDDDARSLSPTPCWPTLYRVVGAIFPVCPAGPRPSATADTRRTGGRGVAGEDQAVCRRGHTCGKHGAGCCRIRRVGHVQAKSAVWTRRTRTRHAVLRLPACRGAHQSTAQLGAACLPRLALPRATSCSLGITSLCCLFLDTDSLALLHRRTFPCHLATGTTGSPPGT